MTDTVRVQIRDASYKALGVIAYVQERIGFFERDHGKAPSKIFLGNLEWTECLKLDPLFDLQIAGIPVVPRLDVSCGVELV